jgi:hypothetical protein
VAGPEVPGAQITPGHRVIKQSACQSPKFGAGGAEAATHDWGAEQW